MDNLINEVIEGFETIPLEESSKVNFLKRMDLKYMASHDQLIAVLEAVKKDYYVMTIKGKRVQGYKTTYFDTPENAFYTAHHNGHNNRLKVRKREYLNTGEHFLEIKRKKLNGNTSKKRTTIEGENDAAVDEQDNLFIQKHVLGGIADLSPKIDTMFFRTTLVSKLFNERVTIDIDLNYKDYEGGVLQTKNLYIVEVKCNKSSGYTPIRKALKDNAVRTGGFSKYCIGRAAMDETLRQNNFKFKVKLLKKHC